MRRFNERGEIINENPFRYLAIGLVVIIGIIIISRLIAGASNSNFSNNAATNNVNVSHSDPGSEGGSSSFNQSSSTPEIVTTPTRVKPVYPSSTPRKTRNTIPIATSISTATYSCRGATPYPPQVKVGDKAYVCTVTDNLIIREQPRQDGDEIFRLPPRTELKIIGGPVCANSNTWWEVEIRAGSQVRYGSYNAPLYALSDTQEGWVREGSDTVDLVYICRK